MKRKLHKNLGDNLFLIYPQYKFSFKMIEEIINFFISLLSFIKLCIYLFFFGLMEGITGKFYEQKREYFLKKVSFYQNNEINLILF
jgi:acyl-coenzyme A synthetase/AMP-(fatty) acid ligase